MAKRAALVLGDNGLIQQLQTGDTIAGISGSAGTVVSGSAGIALSSPVQKVTVSDKALTSAMNVILQPRFEGAILRGIVIECILLRQSAGSFDALLVQKYLDGKPVPTTIARNFVTLNYYGV